MSSTPAEPAGRTPGAVVTATPADPEEAILRRAGYKRGTAGVKPIEELAGDR